MFNFLAGVIVGIVISTVGLSGIANLVDRGVGATKVIIQNNAQ